MAYLEARDISKSFGGVQAVDSASFVAHPGEVHALVGENGAGKSTLLKIVSGLVRAEGGSISLDGVPVRIDGASAAQKLGIGTVFQELTLLPHMSVAENLLLRREPRGSFGLIRRSALGPCARAAMEDLRMPRLDPDTLVAALPLASQQLIEIAKVVLRKPDVLLLDEATSALGERDVEWLFGLIRRLKAEGRTIVFTSHRWKEVSSISDRMTIFRNGRNVATGLTSEIDENRAVELMTGRRIDTVFAPLPPKPKQKTLVSVQQLSAGQVRDVSFSLDAGEILGVGGLSGQGQGDLFQALFGALPLRAGAIAIDGRAVRLGSPRDAIDAGIALVPEDRKGEGLFLPMSIRHNASLPILGRISRYGYVDRQSERERVRQLMEDLNVRAAGDSQPVGSLSGGNQQKILIGRSLLTGAKILLFFDVTRGVDVATKHDIYALMGKLCSEGNGILFYSSDTEEMAHLCHRVLVMSEGRILAELGEGRITGDALVRTALHVDTPPDDRPAPDAAASHRFGVKSTSARMIQ